MTVQQFANHIMTVYNSVQHLGNVSKTAPLKAFRTGLNSEKSRNMLEQAQAAATGTLSLDQMVDKVIVFEQRERDDKLVDQNVDLYAGHSADKESSFSQDKGGSSASLTLEQRHECQKEAIAKLSASDQKVIELGFEIAATNHKHKSAICQDCKVTAKPHVRSDCRNKQQQGSKTKV